MFARSLSTRRSPHRSPHRRSLWARFHDLLAVRASRARLADIDDHLLRDIGISRDQAMEESTRALWDAPVGWRR